MSKFLCKEPCARSSQSRQRSATNSLACVRLPTLDADSTGACSLWASQGNGNGNWNGTGCCNAGYVWSPGIPGLENHKAAGRRRGAYALRVRAVRPDPVGLHRRDEGLGRAGGGQRLHRGRAQRQVDVEARRCRPLDGLRLLDERSHWQPGLAMQSRGQVQRWLVFPVLDLGEMRLSAADSFCKRLQGSPAICHAPVIQRMIFARPCHDPLITQGDNHRK
jgi:hypothetical protein